QTVAGELLDDRLSYAVLLGDDLSWSPLFGQCLQPGALEGVIRTVGAVQRDYRMRRRVEDQKDRVVVRSTPIAPDDVLMAGFRSILGCKRCRFAHVAEDTAFPIDEQGQIFLVECGFCQVKSRSFDFRGIDMWIL